MPLQLRSLPALLLAALLPLTGLAQSPAPEPLELAAAERILLDANPAILQARAAQAAARAGIDMAGARPNPQLTLGSTSTDPGRAGTRGFWNSWTDNTVRVDQLFERGNKRDLRLAAADLNLSASGAELANTIRLARIDLANAWLDLRVAREIRRIANENAALAQRAADAAEVRGKAGDLAGVDVARFRADAARVANDALQAELAHTRARIALAQLLGNRLPSAQLDTSDDWPAAAPAPAGDTGERPDLLAARQRTQQASALRELARAQRTRDVSVGIQYEHAGANANNSYSTTSYGLSVSVPLFINYDYRGEIARSEADYTAAEQQLLATRAAVSNEQARL
ncbi:MAG: hypothetical protein RLZZ220_1830, partial [Pseudomonadota bacterium]